MPAEYAKTGSTIKPYQIEPVVAAAMGRLVRACAEIEDIIGLHLNNLAMLNEGQALILMPRMAVSKKLQLAETFAKVAGGPALEAHNRCFDNDAYTSLTICRNAVAHGLLLGLTDEGKIAFRTVQMLGADETAVSVNVVSYLADDFMKFAELAEALIPYAEENLKLRALREKRRSQDLLPHRKSQATRQPSAKRQRPPKP